jgi:hypothetical protein
MCNCNGYEFGQCPCAKRAAEELRFEQEGFNQLIQVIQLARADLPYKDALKKLKPFIAGNKELQRVIQNMTKDLTVSKRSSTK